VLRQGWLPVRLALNKRTTLMSLKNHFELLATYNQWMNSKIYEAAGQQAVFESGSSFL